jgi:hypothetical protein
MSYQQTFTCDVCGAVRGPSNHWLLSHMKEGGIFFAEWDMEEAIFGARTHLCGETCAATHLTRFIAKQREETI